MKNNKTKNTPKNIEGKTNKKVKGKNKKNTQLSDVKTIKKPKNIVKINLSEESFNSFESIKKQEPL